jgi:hypothetical protein
MPEQASTFSTSSTLVVSDLTNSQKNPASVSILGGESRPSGVIKATNLLVTHTVSTQGSSTAADIWGVVLKEHLAKLKPRDRSFCLEVRCNTSLDEAALEEIFKPLKKRYDEGIFRIMMRRIVPVLSHVLSFGKAVGVAVGQGGTAAGLIWGGMRILLEV